MRNASGDQKQFWGGGAPNTHPNISLTTFDKVTKPVPSSSSVSSIILSRPLGHSIKDDWIVDEKKTKSFRRCCLFVFLKITEEVGTTVTAIFKLIVT